MWYTANLPDTVFLQCNDGGGANSMGAELNNIKLLAQEVGGYNVPVN